jgi:hypothetical protein
MAEADFSIHTPAGMGLQWPRYKMVTTITAPQ